MKFVLALFAAAVCATAFAAESSAKPDASKGQAIASQVCAACHAADGNSTITANPKLAGQIPEYIAKQLANFKAAPGKKAERENSVMAGMVANLSPNDMKNLAAYFASQKAKGGVARNKELAALGRKIWRGGIAEKGVAACASCHGAAGAGVPAQYPLLAGQHAEYTESQLKAFRAGQRENDTANMMRMTAAKLSDREIQAVADFIAGLR
jgi:cytochrome c553